jgi:death on curing protein
VTEPLWLSKELVFILHERLIAEFGGLAGIRDEGLLESALGKPQNLFTCASPSVSDLAASYASGIVGNHPFLDGNKRTGFAAAAVFIETNGYRLTAKEVEATSATLALAEGTMSEEGYARWLAEHSTKAAVKSKEGKRPARKRKS